MKKLLLILFASMCTLTIEANRINFINLTKHEMKYRVSVEFIETSKFGFFTDSDETTINGYIIPNKIMYFDYETPDNFLTDNSKSRNKFNKFIAIEIIDMHDKDVMTYKCNKTNHKKLNDELLENEHISVYITLNENNQITLSIKSNDL